MVEKKPKYDWWKIAIAIIAVAVVGLGVVQFTGVWDPEMEQGSTRFDNIVFQTTADCNGVADCFVVDADGDTTLSADTDDQINFELGGADEVTMNASTFSIADMVISQTAGTENIGLPTVHSFSIDIDNASSPQTCATVAAAETWFIHAVYANVLQDFVCTGDDCVFDVGDAGDQDGLLDLDDAELQTADTEGTGAPAGWQGFMSTATRGAYEAAGTGFVYVGAPTNIVCTYGGTDLAGDGTTANDITIYIVYTRVN